MEVSGDIRADPTAPPLAGATVHVVVQSTTRADAAAVEVARLEFDGVALRPDGPPMPFVIDAPDIDPHERYEVRVHADLIGDGRVAPEDQVSMESLPVLTQGAPAAVSVQLRRVNY